MNNTKGMATSPFTYFVPIWAADGGTGAPNMFYAIDPSTGIFYPIGPIGAGITAMFYAGPTLWATTSGNYNGSTNTQPPLLLTINPMTGAGTTRAVMTTWFRDITFDFNLSKPIGTNPCNLLTFEANGTENAPIGSGVPNCTPGGAIAQDAAIANVYFMATADNTQPLYSVNTTTGVFTAGPIMSGGIAGGRFTAAAFHNGTLYAVEGDGKLLNRQLSTVNTTTGVLTPVGPTLTGSYISAIVSPTR